MNQTNRTQKVFTVSSRLQALILQEELSRAGIPVEIIKSHRHSSHDLVTENRFAYDARAILMSTALSVETISRL